MDSWPPVPQWFTLYGGDGQGAPEPPPPPEGPTYKMFGATYETQLPRAELQEQLFSEEAPTATEMQRMNEEMMQLYKQLLRGEGDADELLHGIQVRLSNMFYVLNSYRPQQARQELAERMRAEIAEKKRLLEEMRAACAEIEQSLQ